MNFKPLLYVSIAFLSLLGGMWGEVSLILLSTILALFLMFSYGKFSPVNPLCWLSFFTTLYHMSFFVLVWMGIRESDNTIQIALINQLCLLAIFMASFLFSEIGDENFNRIRKPIEIKRSDLLILWVVSISLCIWVLFDFLTSEARIKSEYEGQGISMFRILLVPFFIYLINSVLRNRNIYMQTALIAMFLLFSSLILGERDILLGFIVSFLFLYYILIGKSKIKIIFAGVGVLLTIPLMGVYKNIFTRGDIVVHKSVPFYVSLLDGEFRGAGYNLDVILSYFSNEDLFWGSTVLGDIARSFIPAQIYVYQNSVSWYNNTFHPEIVAQGRGYGFSFAAEGLVNFGYIGVFLWFFLLSVLVFYLFKKAKKNSKYLLIYILVIPIVIYSLRGDISTLLSPIIKAILLPLIFLELLSSTMKKKNLN